MPVGVPAGEGGIARIVYCVRGRTGKDGPASLILNSSVRSAAVIEESFEPAS